MKIIYQNSWDAAEAIRGKFIALTTLEKRNDLKSVIP